MIRDAVSGDIPALLEIGRKFAEMARLQEFVGFDPDTLAITLERLIDAPEGICLIGDSGAAGGLVHPSIYNAAHITGQELFWWSEGREGLALFGALEQAARDRGAHSWAMITLDAIEPEKTGRFYERRGYSPMERSYLKVF